MYQLWTELKKISSLKGFPDKGMGAFCIFGEPVAQMTIAEVDDIVEVSDEANAFIRMLIKETERLTNQGKNLLRILVSSCWIPLLKR